MKQKNFIIIIIFIIIISCVALYSFLYQPRELFGVVKVDKSSVDLCVITSDRGNIVELTEKELTYFLDMMGTAKIQLLYPNDEISSFYKSWFVGFYNNKTYMTFQIYDSGHLRIGDRKFKIIDDPGGLIDYFVAR